MSQTSGKLYMLPVALAYTGWHALPPEAIRLSGGIKHFYVENLRSARRALRKMHPGLNLEEIRFEELEKHSQTDYRILREWLKAGIDVGMLSEAGCPGIADPGAELAAAAHAIGAPVVPVTGPSSIILALMASGLNGQSFAFNGYLPVKNPERSKRLAALEMHARKESQTQIFIETPYRNNAMLADLLQTCAPTTRLCIATNLTDETEKVTTRTVKEWKAANATLPKEPAIFLFLP